MTNNQINYIEFQGSDLEKIKEFYSKTFGWKFTDYGPDYVAFNDGSFDGGFANGNSKSTNAPLIVLYSKDLECCLKAVEQNGGAIIKPVYTFPGGRRFHFTDPTGNELAVWSE